MKKKICALFVLFAFISPAAVRADDATNAQLLAALQQLVVLLTEKLDRLIAEMEAQRNVPTIATTTPSIYGTPIIPVGAPAGIRLYSGNPIITPAASPVPVYTGTNIPITSPAPTHPAPKYQNESKVNEATAAGYYIQPVPVLPVFAWKQEPITTATRLCDNPVLAERGITSWQVRTTGETTQLSVYGLSSWYPPRATTTQASGIEVATDNDMLKDGTYTAKLNARNKSGEKIEYTKTITLPVLDPHDTSTCDKEYTF